jgi:hypothetical protein
MNKIAMLASKAFEVEKRTPRTNQEQVRLIRIGDEEIEASPDGFELNVPGLDASVCGNVSSRSFCSAQLGLTARWNRRRPRARA